MDKLIQDYDKENDILFVHVNGIKTKESIEINNINIVLDLDERGDIVGFEIFDFYKKIKRW